MAKKLSEYNSGDKVEMMCYQIGCKGISIPVVLGNEERIEPGTWFTDAGRFHWPKNTQRKVFGLKEYCRCPNCRTLLGSVNIVGVNKENPFIFGYDPEPA